MTTIRPYEETDASAVGRLIADTYRDFNLGFATPEEQARLLGPFQHARSADPGHQATIARVLRAAVVLVAEQEETVVGVLRGSPGRLHSLFVRGDYHRQGIGRQLMARFEATCREQGAATITLASTLFAVPFYQALGYKRSTGMRHMRSFEGEHLPYQPMRKVLLPTSREARAVHASMRRSAQG